MVYYRYFGRFQVDQIVVSSDEFIAVAYVLEEDDENNRRLNNEQQLLNLTNFQYKLQPTDDICMHSDDLLGLLLQFKTLKFMLPVQRDRKRTYCNLYLQLY